MIDIMLVLIVMLTVYTLGFFNGWLATTKENVRRDEYLKRNSDYRDAKFKYVEDKLNDYLNTDEATVGFQKIFSIINVSHDFRKKVWLAHLDEKRIEFEKDFDNL